MASGKDARMQSKERTRLVYENIARFYGAFRSRNGLGRILRYLDVEENMLLLDCGTGPGKHAESIARQHPGMTVIGLDITENFLRIAKRRVEKKQMTNLLLLRGDAEHLPFEAETFDRIMCVEVLLLLQDKKRTAAEFYRILKKGGILLVVEPSRRFLPWREFFYAAIFPLAARIIRTRTPETAKCRKEDYAGRKFRPEELEKLLKEAPFASVEVHTKLTHMYAVCRK